MTTKDLMLKLRSAINKGDYVPELDHVVAGVTSGTPVNAVAAARVLTVGGTPAEANTVSLDGVVYKYRAAIGDGVFATQTLTTTDVFHEGDTVTIGATTSAKTYTITATITAANSVKLTAAAETTIDNLVLAINGGTGAGVNYGSGTVAHTIFSASKATAATMLVTAKVKGFAANIATTQVCTHATWGAATATGGVDPQAANDVLIGANAEAAIDNLVLAVTKGANIGVKYGTGTVANPFVTAAKASVATMTATAREAGTSGNAIVIAKAGTNLTWASSAVLLAGGIDGTVAPDKSFYLDATYLYFTAVANTVSGANWKRLTLGSAF